MDVKFTKLTSNECVFLSTFTQRRIHKQLLVTARIRWLILSFSSWKIYPDKFPYKDAAAKN